MNWSIEIGRIFGIKIKVHYIFLMLLLFIGLSAALSGGLIAALSVVIFVVTVFGLVVLHELGHSMMAIKHGVRVRDITLLPIGGVARLEQIPENPWTEIKIALAGPAVNVAIGILLLPFLATSLIGTMFFSFSLSWFDFLANLFFVNAMMVLFNMIPAFPLDGGRVLRAIFALRKDYLAATYRAVRIGRWIAIAMGVFGLLTFAESGFWLIILAVFIYFAGAQELMAVRFRRYSGDPYMNDPTDGGVNGKTLFRYWESPHEAHDSRDPEHEGRSFRGDEPADISAEMERMIARMRSFRRPR